ncbi:3-oxoacyl-[acyl-carrier-protein] synthase II/minimal PKS ketosynthase (KS/KS alpha) [Thermosporothrix hazakensis]|jgi:3-oxoacyl-(acyl-carrier-protein) synthase|uniref:3-oxoacyl-[acyl-carrier-protein] synthase II/minimal PKS ketosynthase (KS/KS alpha) n=1 Tax=Thermosporothrix hazakensis TaxID=644383 RepID=A0A326TP85_THEHA|nr:beta-ketoacyl-[acyl-carrier-protein] synthase family protein [Thermosporothrix hazakensis]PZW18313.1 3-oxoacyl-[acyl-carrier-protein] synthase II/minimal PKS ketosynthase (KS/KS alpha) [Thermosporothrix hazakensis]GCE51439.1 putative polyketide beta-ketoacyl synthase 1 [Thermosporothrix hazakensis]
MRRVVITGLGVISPVGVGKEAFWQNLIQGVSGEVTLDQVTCCDLFRYHQMRARVVCEAADFRLNEAAVPLAYHHADRFLQFALAASHEAVQDAALNFSTIARTRAGVILATAICGTQMLDREYAKLTNKGKKPLSTQGVSPFLYSAAMGNSAALAVAARYGLQGECSTLSTGCIGGTDAISYAYDAIACGEQDLIITGASEAPITPITIAAFDIINCLSHCQTAKRASRPFSRGRDGFVLSEGCGIVVLEELEHARARNAPIYAELLGWDVTEHATHMTDMSPEGRDLARAVQGALQCAHMEPDQLDFVNAHGTSTPQNDVRETSALKTALGEHARSIPINSTKSMLGHALAAASAVEIVACALSLQRQYIHPTINLDEPDPACDLDYVSDGGRAQPIRYLLTTASGFSGLHAALIMGTPERAL